MKNQDSTVSVWSLSSAQLAHKCRLIAEVDSGAADPALRAEASRLYAAWQDALELSGSDSDTRERKAAQQAGLRKRTIEILIKYAGQRSGNP